MGNSIGMEILVILAILAGPFIGIWAQGKLENRKQAKERKLEIFKTLMANRATPLSPDFVGALNRIDIEFVGEKEKEVTSAWNSLLNHFGEGPNPPSFPPAKASQAEREQYERESRIYENAFARWIERADELRTKLLKEMSAQLGYNFDEVHIRKAAYNPRLHGELEMTQQSLLKAVDEVFAGKRPLPMFITNWAGQQGGDERE